MSRARLAAAALAMVALASSAVACGGDDEDPRSTGAAAGKDRTPTVSRDLRLQQIGDFRAPVHVAQPPGDGDLLVVAEKRGVIRVLRRGRELRRPFLDLRKRVRYQGTEQGLLSVAFAPAYPASGRVYVSYTDRGGDLRVDEFRRSRRFRTRARISTRRPVLSIKQPTPIHNGGHLVFGPDGRLYVGTGDGGPSYDPRGDGPDRRILRGKILRIEPRPGNGRRYAIPKGNPYRGDPVRAPEIWAYGLRNPWRFSFDRRSGKLIIGDVGQDEIEEITFLGPARARGANLGWSAYEGTRLFDPGRRRGNEIRPYFEYSHERGCSVVGGFVVRDRRLRTLRGRYLFADFCEGELRSIRPPGPGPGTRDERRLGLTVPGIVSFAADELDRVYAVSISGPVYRLAPRR